MAEAAFSRLPHAVRPSTWFSSSTRPQNPDSALQEHISTPFLRPGQGNSSTTGAGVHHEVCSLKELLSCADALAKRVVRIRDHPIDGVHVPVCVCQKAQLAEVLLDGADKLLPPTLFL